MDVKRVQTTGWTNPALTARFWAAMEDQQRQERAKALIRLRKARGWSAERLAQEAKVSSKTVSRIETADVDEPHTGTIKKLAVALDAQIEDINGPAPPMEGEPGPIERLENRLEKMQESLEQLLARLPEARPLSTGALPTPPGALGHDLATDPPKRRSRGRKRNPPGEDATGDSAK